MRQRAPGSAAQAKTNQNVRIIGKSFSGTKLTSTKLPDADGDDDR